jgi:hypothetical protein
MNPHVVVTVERTPGGRLPSGDPDGRGGQTRYGLAITTNGIDRQVVVQPKWDSPRSAYSAADALQRKLDKETLA